ncbi:MAG: energy transducer TonB [Steroidobacteraceae bacterium]|nr:energy transducer TonB [Steroidobacteraceae bacterium]
MAARALVLLLMATSAAATPSKPRILETTPPIYPEDSRRAQEHGDVSVRVFITKDGTVASAEVARSSGFPALDSAAVDAAKRWKFSAGTDEAGNAVDAPLQFKVQFNLDHSAPPPATFDAETKRKVEEEWYSLIHFSTIVDRTWRRCRSLTQPSNSVEQYPAFFAVLAPEISVRESYMHLYFKDAPREAVKKMLRDEHQISAAVISNMIQNATLNNKSPKIACVPFTAAMQFGMDRFMQRKSVDWDAPQMAPIRVLHLQRRKPLEPKR